jgi:ATP-dependent DNA helicase RecQ
LRAARRVYADDRGVPPYVVCHDRTLAEIAALRPTTLAELSAVHGMGPARLDAYGEGFIAVVEKGS